MGLPQGSGLERILDFATDSSGDSDNEGYMARPLIQNVYQSPETLPGYTSGMIPFNSSPYQEKPNVRYDSVTSVPISSAEVSYHSQSGYHHPTASADSIHGMSASGSWPRDEISASSLHDAMGELRIDANGMGKHPGLFHDLTDIKKKHRILSSRRKLWPKHPPWMRLNSPFQQP